MPNRTALANGADPVQQIAAADANAVQGAVNLVAVVGCFHRHLLALHRSGVGGDDLINHPVSLAFTSKLSSPCRMTLDREIAALSAIDRLERGEVVEYEVIPLRGHRINRRHSNGKEAVDDSGNRSATTILLPSEY